MPATNSIQLVTQTVCLFAATFYSPQAFTKNNNKDHPYPAVLCGAELQ